MIEMNIKERQYDDRLQKMFAPGERRVGKRELLATVEAID
jgi:hypothetical protein